MSPTALRSSLCPFQLCGLGREASRLSLRFFTCKRRIMNPLPPRLGKRGRARRWQCAGRVPSTWWACGRRKAPGGGFGRGPRTQPCRPEAGSEPGSASPRVPAHPDQVPQTVITQKPSPATPSPSGKHAATNYPRSKQQNQQSPSSFGVLSHEHDIQECPQTESKWLTYRVQYFSNFHFPFLPFSQKA